MAKGRTTLKQLASILGVSISTISKALNGGHEISEKLKDVLLRLPKRKITDLIKLHWV